MPVGIARRRSDARRRQLFQNLAVSQLWKKSYEVSRWLEHMREHHDRRSVSDTGHQHMARSLAAGQAQRCSTCCRPTAGVRGRFPPPVSTYFRAIRLIRERWSARSAFSKRITFKPCAVPGAGHRSRFVGRLEKGEQCGVGVR
ncbi:hypothetical protein D6T65_15645 [Arthrobacter frigidicola]|nr:hypothetical protein D6T65_15645 [Arthrobacter frigidicola]